MIKFLSTSADIHFETEVEKNRHNRIMSILDETFSSDKKGIEKIRKKNVEVNSERCIINETIKRFKFILFSSQ